MSGNDPVDPVGIPVFTGDLALLDTKVTALSGSGARIATAAGDVHSSFGQLRAFYKAPEAEQLFATTKPVADTGLDLSSDLCVISRRAGHLLGRRLPPGRKTQGTEAGSGHLPREGRRRRQVA